MLGSLLKRTIVASVIATEKIQPKNIAIQKVLSWVAIRAVSTYRISLSRFIGQDCLFRPTCSRHALNVLKEHGWSKGIVLAAAQLRDCGGGYSLRMGAAGVEMVTESGRTVPEAQLAPFVTDKLRPPAVMPT